MPLTDKIAVITGATGRLGPVVARVFASQGVRLALSGTSPDELAATVSNLGFPSSRIFTAARDLMDEASAMALADGVIERYGRADIILHLVGGYQPGGVVGLPTEAWEYMMNINLRTYLNVLRAFLPYLTANGWGRVIALSSVLADKPTAQSAAYSAAKAGVEALTLSVAQEVKDKGVTANIVVVKTIDTVEERVEGRAGSASPEEIADLFLYLCSDEAAPINGARIPVYGR